MNLFKLTTKDGEQYLLANNMTVALSRYETGYVTSIEHLSDNVITVSENNTVIAPSELLYTFCTVNKLNIEAVQSADRSKYLAEARRTIAYLLETELACSLSRIAGLINKDHTSVMHYKASMVKQLEAKEGLAYEYLMNYYNATAE